MDTAGLGRPRWIAAFRPGRPRRSSALPGSPAAPGRAGPLLTGTAGGDGSGERGTTGSVGGKGGAWPEVKAARGARREVWAEGVERSRNFKPCAGHDRKYRRKRRSREACREVRALREPPCFPRCARTPQILLKRPQNAPKRPRRAPLPHKGTRGVDPPPPPPQKGPEPKRPRLPTPPKPKRSPQSLRPGLRCLPRLTTPATPVMTAASGPAPRRGSAHTEASPPLQLRRGAGKPRPQIGPTLRKPPAQIDALFRRGPASISPAP